MACVNKSNSNNFLTWNKVVGNLTLAQLQASGMPDYCDNLNMSAPQNLIATSISTTEIDLDWDVADVTPDNILVYRSTDGVTYALIATITGSLIAYSDTGLTDGTLYYYKIKATGDVDSAYSNVSTAYTALDFVNALSSDGVTDYVKVGTGIQSQSVPDECSWAFYYKTNTFITSYTDGDIIFGDSNTGNVDLFQIRVLVNTSTSSISFRIASRTASAALTKIGTTNLWSIMNDSNWHTIVITRKEDPLDTTKFRYYFFIDGTSLPAAGDTSILKTQTPAVYGDSENNIMAGGSGAACINGQLDEFRIIESYLEASDATLDYNSGLGSNYLVDNFTTKLHYKFNEGVAGANNTAIAAPEITDSSGNAYHGTLSAGFAKNGTISNWVAH